jgi:cob(I)alamin adenosyltransferase
MKIYTRRGDDGRTELPGGERVPKSAPLTTALGALDELNAHLGLCVQCAGTPAAVREVLEPVQAELLAMGALLAGAGGEWALDGAVARLERQIDEQTQKLPALRHFVLPGGCESAGRLHVARCVCRRAERAAVAAAEAARAEVGRAVPAVVLRYLNRLSDLLFTLARVASAADGAGDALWAP